MFTLVVVALPCEDLVGAIIEQQTKTPAKAPLPPAVRVNRTIPKVTPIAAFPVFSKNPSDEDIIRARVFEEPLVPFATGNENENRALSAALLSYLKGGNTEDLSALESFLQTHPQSVWRVSLLTNMGIVYRRTGYFTRALAAWDEAWRLGKTDPRPTQRAIADRAVAELAELNARLGRYDILESIFEEIDSRNIGGSPAEKIRGAKQGLWLMKNRPGEAFRCGPMALDRILSFTNADYDREKIKSSQSTMHGMSLPQVLNLSRDLGMRLQMAMRSVGTDVLLPAVIHWKAGHYAALLKEQDGRYLVQDPTFGDEFWVSRSALDEQSSGYFLVSTGKLPEGWRAVAAAEGNQVWGKGNTNSDDPHAMTQDDEKARGPYCPTKGMADYNIHLMLVSLNIVDTPVGYVPPRGPAVEFQVTYNYRESFQPSIFSYSNLGPKWTFDWLSYVKDDPSNLTASAYLYVRGGGEQVFSGFNSSTQSYAPEFRSRAILTRTSTTPIRYERHLPDGSLEVFAQPDGAATFPRRIFMTEWRDAAGNGLTLTYDANLRLVALTDAVGQVTTLSYELGSDPLKITKVTDPFGRFATLEYTATGRLRRITDVIGIQSQFTYGNGDFISALTTAYGTTLFQYGESGRRRWLEATDPIGGTERVEFQPDAPGIPVPGEQVPTGLEATSSYLNYRNSFYWDKRAWSLYSGDYTKATLYHWLHSTDINVTSGILESMKRPLETRIFYDYPGQGGAAWNLGSTAQPIAVARVLDDGSTQLYRYEYNLVGKITKFTDPLGRETVFIYGTNNVPDPDPANGTGIDLLEVRQKNGAVYDVLETSTYNAQHLRLTITDAARQTTTFTYRTTGEPETVVTPARSGLSQAERTTTFTYYADNAPLGPGRLQRITGPITGATTDFAYDGFGRPRTVTESDGYTLTTDYDNLDRPTRLTYPDGTYEETVYNRLDPASRRDRLGRWTYFFYDSLRRLVVTRDPLGRVVTQDWCNCGALTKLIDANGNATTWDRDAQGRITKEIRADNSQTLFDYENRTSRLKRRTDARGQYRDITYFKDDNILQISYPNAFLATATVSFTYNSAYNRIATMVDGTGTTSYTYHPVTTGGTLGASQVATVDGPLSNDIISYSYDELGRMVNRSINSVAATQTYDALGRLQSATNVLGTFNYNYVNQTARVQSVTYPNGQTTTYGYFPNSGDRRLQEILNQKTGNITISKFNYTYDAAGNIATWTQQTDSDPAKAYDLTDDRADQLTGATWRTTDPTPSILKRFGYAYDSAGNRTTEQIDDVPLKASYNNMNRLLTQDPGGVTRFAGRLSEAAKVTVQGKPATVTADNKFVGTATLVGGTNTLQAQATDYTGNTRTSTYQVTVAGNTKTFAHDANGNLTSDGTRTFEWDAENRLLAINNGTHRSEFTYDGMSQRVRIIEKDNSVVASDVRFTWCNLEICEERDSTGATVTKRFFGQGEEIGSADYFYTTDHLGSVREMADASGVLQVRYDYDLYGRQTKLSGSIDADFGYSEHYAHAATGLVLSLFRAYDANLGRWISEDPAGIAGGDLNFYGYVHNKPANLIDPFGLADSASPWRLGWEWLSGGQKTHNFVDGDPFTELLKKHDNIQRLVARACVGALPPKGQWDNELHDFQGVPKYFKDYSTILTLGYTGNLAATYLGSYDLDYTITGQTLNIHVTNESKISSGTRPPVIGYTEWWANHVGRRLDAFFSSGPMSTTNQTFDFQVDLRRGNGNCACK
jgi:RHS repeat-associated protein